jgi:hypothetical protein
VCFPTSTRKFTLKSEIFRHKTSHMVLSIIFLEDKHHISLHLSIFYEYQQFFQYRICFSIQPQLQLVNLHRNRWYFVIKLHIWFCLSYFLKTSIQFYCIYQYFMSINSFFNTVSVSRYTCPISDPWSRLARSSSFFLIMLFNNYSYNSIYKHVSEIKIHQSKKNLHSFYLFNVLFSQSIKTILKSPL